MSGRERARFGLRIAWLLLRLVAVIWMSDTGARFLYQGY